MKRRILLSILCLACVGLLSITDGHVANKHTVTAATSDTFLDVNNGWVDAGDAVYVIDGTSITYNKGSSEWASLAKNVSSADLSNYTKAVVSVSASTAQNLLVKIEGTITLEKKITTTAQGTVVEFPLDIFTGSQRDEINIIRIFAQPEVMGVSGAFNIDYAYFTTQGSAGYNIQNFSNYTDVNFAVSFANNTTIINYTAAKGEWNAMNWTFPASIANLYSKLVVTYQIENGRPFTVKLDGGGSSKEWNLPAGTGSIQTATINITEIASRTGLNTVSIFPNFGVTGTAGTAYIYKLEFTDRVGVTKVTANQTAAATLASLKLAYSVDGPVYTPDYETSGLRFGTTFNLVNYDSAGVLVIPTNKLGGETIMNYFLTRGDREFNPAISSLLNIVAEDIVAETGTIFFNGVLANIPTSSYDVDFTVVLYYMSGNTMFHSTVGHASFMDVVEATLALSITEDQRAVLTIIQNQFGGN